MKNFKNLVRELDKKGVEPHSDDVPFYAKLGVTAIRSPIERIVSLICQDYSKYYNQ